MMKYLQLPEVLAAGIWVFVVAIVGGLLTEIGPWYYALKQPSWKPPDWAFGVIWTIIFVLSAIAWVKAYDLSSNTQEIIILATLFIVNGVLNALWSLLYFKLHRPDWSLIEAFFLWFSVLLIILVMLRISKVAALLMLPYLIWVSCAIALNYATIRLNGPFK
jgi:translocator protein